MKRKQRPKPTQARLRELLKYNRKTGEFICRKKRATLRPQPKTTS